MIVTPERWRQIDKILEDALDLDPAKWSDFLQNACANDESLHKEILLILQSLRGAENFLEKPPEAEISRLLFQKPKPISEMIGPYRILNLLGKGGMGEVYRALDTRLDRNVAIKVLPQHLTTDPAALKRFQREAKAIAALNHPNILAIYEFDTTNSISFVVTELLEGETLRVRIARQPLDEKAAVEIAIAVADALSAAHNKGVIHRDLKPENIFLTSDGRVKILDFGLARIIPAVSEQEVAQVETGAGFVRGTIPYMSPEQLRGTELDARTDIFSFGCVLYEMLTGCKAFHHTSNEETIGAILHKEPPSLNEKISAPVHDIVSRCLKKEPTERFASAQELLSALQLVNTLKEPLPVVPTLRNLLVRQISSKTIISAVLILGILISSFVIYRTLKKEEPGKDSINSIVVLPFKNATPNPENEYLSDGLTESLINILSGLPNLKVIARSTVFTYKGKNVDPIKIGNQLKVRSVLMGELVQRGNTIIVQADLVDAHDGSQLWGKQYNRKFSDIISMQDEISRDIAEHLRFKLTGEEKRILTKDYTKDAQAYQLYLKGRYYWNKYTLDGFKKSIQYYQQAIEKDPTYALAYAGLAQTYGVLSGDGMELAKEVMPKSKAAAMKALEIDETLAEAHNSLGIYKMYYEWDWPGAEREYKRALELKPNYSDTYHFYGHYLQGVGKLDKAISIISHGVELDPLSLVMNAELADACYLARRNDRGLDVINKTIEMDPSFVFAHWVQARLYTQKGMYQNALEVMERDTKINDWPYTIGELGYIHARLGHRNEALKILQEMKERSSRQFVDPPLFGFIYEALGNRDEALIWFKKMFDERSSWVCFHKDPMFDPVRSDPRFVQLLHSANLQP